MTAAFEQVGLSDHLVADRCQRINRILEGILILESQGNFLLEDVDGDLL